MTELLTAAQMRAIEQAAIESGQVTGLELMERAGRGVVEAVFEEWPELAAAPHRAVVLCGPGNNGGDGFVVARLLKGWGWEVEVFLYGDPAKLPPDAKVNYELWGEMGEVSPIPEGFWLPDCDLLVDALFGTGLSRPIPEEINYSLSYLWKAWFKVVAVDIPSGLCADSGRGLGASGRADVTVTFHQPKIGHFIGEGAAACGRLVTKSIALKTPSVLSLAKAKDPGLQGVDITDPRILRAMKVESNPLWEKIECLQDKVDVIEPMHALNGPGVVHVNELPKTPRVPQKGANKYTYGHALILSGGAGRTGAARLAARGALRIGAGLVTIGVPGAAQQEVACQITALMLRRAGTPDEVAAVLEDDRLNAVCLGPGLGVERAHELVPVAVRAEHAPYVVLDADALSAFGDAPEALFDQLHERCVLTPHGGEFARLFPDIAEKLNATPTKGPAYSKVDATRAAARRAGCVVLFKGPDTVIAAPDGRCSINSAQYDRAAPWLATAGSGDVLAGFITGLLARGFSPIQAAETAAWLHVECARRFGPGLIAEDLTEELPGVFRDLERLATDRIRVSL